MGLMKVLKKMARIAVTQVTVRPRDRRLYGQISHGYATTKGVRAMS
jgi:hypothetical protein